MPRPLTPRRAPDRDERGAVAIIVAMALTGLLVVTAMVLDFGLLRIDRQIDRSSADAATLAGLHGLNTGDGIPHPYAGVCTAVRYLKANNERFSGINPSAGWSNGLGSATGDGCTSTTLRNTTCSSNKATWARWHWAGTSRGVDLDVTVESGYDLAANQWQEDSLSATSPDNGDPAYAGCDHLAVTITQAREPGLGSLATSSDLETGIRSVGRIKGVPGDSAPAMLLLRRTGCPVLKTGSSGGGSFVHVEGAVAPNGKTQPGTIHADSDGTGCSGNIYGGLSANGIVAYAAPMASNPLVADASKPGSITSVAAAAGITGTVIRDSLTNVYGSTALTSGGTKTEVLGRSLVTRRLVDERFFPGVKAAMAGANAVAFNLGASGPPDSTWKRFPSTMSAADRCKPTQTQIAALNLTAADKLYIDCDGKFVGDNAGNTFFAGTIYFRGWVNPAGPLKLVNAHHVYIGNHGNNSDAVSLGTGAEFQVHTAGNTDLTGNCTTGQSPSKAVLFVRTGQFKETAGLLRMCRTSVMMMGGSVTGCVPTLPGAAPNLLTPCAGGLTSLGTGQFTQNGGGIDWTAPDTLDATTDPGTGDPTPAAIAAWRDVNGMEDLALWSESGTNSSTNFSMAGGGLFRVRGVFMTPNAGPFIISGGASLNLTNAQYVTSSIELNGSGTNITMRVDPNAAVTLPDQGLVGLVR